MKFIIVIHNEKLNNIIMWRKNVHLRIFILNKMLMN